ncbi:hypothetical protein O181_085729 [Austropuccinia psidii MF-1]|uniref:Chromo domain-containing protein n=1 Tax=Austropuccinia psidii MF-1 TaxID=1389203 RepID=A0A9Q3FVL8_9BASI|nr:hypothetical protein [Austropuccinia psidii MF-1]
MSSKVLTCRQACWAALLSVFHFSITYCPGRLATLPDSLSRRDNMYPERGVDFISKNLQNFHQLLKQNEIKESRFFSIKVEVFSDLVDQIQKEVWQDRDHKEILKQLARGESVSDYTLEPQAKLVLFKERVVISRNHDIKLDILQKHHDSPIKDYVSSFQQCSRNKNIHNKKFGLLKPLQIPPGPWNSLSIDFITQLPLSSNFDSILVVVDRLSKMAIFIPAYSTITALDLAQIFISHFFSKHGLPISIQLKISRDLSAAFHPETDGQTESVNHIQEQYLWMYVSYHQDDWHTWIPLVEFAYNNAENSSKKSPFLTIYGRNPSFDSIHISQGTPSGNLSTKLQSVQQAVKEELESEIKHFKKYSDRNRDIPPYFQPGDRVWLASKKIKTTIPPKKLSERWLGPFEALKKIGSHAYHLKLPQQWKSVYPVFQFSLLEPVKQSTIPNRHQLPTPPVIVEEQEEWEVAQVLDSKLKRGTLWYLVEWKGFNEDPERTTWDPSFNLTNFPDLVKYFHTLYPDKPGPNASRVSFMVLGGDWSL